MSKAGTQYRHNHYVPKWYQKRFLRPDQSKYWYLDLKPETRVSNGVNYQRRGLMHWGPDRCFAQDDLYTVTISGQRFTELEQYFFGEVDTEGKVAIEKLADVEHPAHEMFPQSDLVHYLSVQKLRTPKGLVQLSHASGVRGKASVLDIVYRHQNIFCAVWSECVWQIADASNSPTKFIISDHPVTVYNRDCFPQSKHCIGSHDPDIRFVASHTYFPLSLNKVLILTNLSWARNPYQNPLNVRPNPSFHRPTVFNYLHLNTGRMLSEEEVVEINYITKRRAFRYIASAEQEWLYPERRLKSDHWRKLGDGYLFMSDPRFLTGGGEIVIGFKGGGGAAFDAYGHRPHQDEYMNAKREAQEWDAMQRFKAEWSGIVGPEYRGVPIEWQMHREGREPIRADEFHREELRRDEQYKNRSGEQRRRRQLKRINSGLK
ncbi:DUF4238 domain-containing protein [Thalassospira lucentensis]|uniref:DUF4238 domain-containing protein n=1 Tax=Thalassospira lucentensis TaxID=168935 RepID=A0A358HZ50_9PROT|nr:DUF4238 domain-containing protein [Thalassospira lucentensis]HBV00457.1 hypothetical protein [Thalassospira lucentensis]HCW69045.1 hypothetical protein [Thalassospira lucentensis]|tara:strand:+ start:965 stop:2257 length:1293 start_codon:yes stop_codon:yes gene_type:complete